MTMEQTTTTTTNAGGAAAANVAKDDDDDDMTIDERLTWLRDRGVQIETPEERQLSQVTRALRDSDVTDNDVDTVEAEEIYYLFLPADPSESIQEHSFRPRRRQSSNATAAPQPDLLLEHLQPFFRTGTADLSLLPEANAVTLSSDSSVPSVSHETLQQVAQEAHVETFTLIHPVPSNQFVSIRFYLDELGLLKRLPLNRRAATLARLAGYDPPPLFYGNVYAARTHPHELSSLHWTAGLESLLAGNSTGDATPEWLRQASRDNLEYQMAQNKLTGRSKQQQPLVDGHERPKLEEHGLYSWTQSEEELEVKLPTASSIVSKNIQVVFRPTLLRVTVMNHLVVNINLFESIDVDSCTWTLEEADHPSSELTKVIVISMEKQESALWPRIRD